MIIELETDSSDCKAKPSLKMIPESSTEAFQLGIIAGQMKGKAVTHTYSMCKGSQMFLRVPIAEKAQ